MGSKGCRQRSLGRLDKLTLALPPLTPTNAVKLKPSWDRSCTRRISNACVEESWEDDAFNNWRQQASRLRPSVLRSPQNSNYRGKLRAHWQAHESSHDSSDDSTGASQRRQICEEKSTDSQVRQICEEKSNDSNLISPKQSFRQHILTQVKLKLGAAVPGKHRSSVERGAKPQVAAKERSAASEPDMHHVQVKPARIPPRPRAPAYPGARESKAPGDQEVAKHTNATKAEQAKNKNLTCEHTEKKSDESDGIYEDDCSSCCESDF